MVECYTAVMVSVVLIMLIAAGLANANNILSQRTRTGLIISFVMIMLAAFFEWLSFMLSGHIQFRTLLIISKIIEFSLAPIVPVIFAGSFDDLGQARKMAVLLAIHFVIEVLSPFGGFIFYVDSAGVYHRGRNYYIYVIFFLAGLAFLIRMFSKYWSKYQNGNRYIIIAILVFLCSGVIIQFSCQEAKISWLTISITALLTYVYHIELLQQIDPLTTLLNRSVYENNIRDINKEVEFLYIDIDKFKTINDQFGHAEGDRILRSMGKTIKHIYGRWGKCYRIGGDEFCIILDKSNKNSEGLNKRLDDVIRDKQGSNPHFPTVSLGMALYDPLSKESAFDAAKRADEVMYEVKKEKAAIVK